MLHTLLYFLALTSLSTSPVWAKLNQMPSEVLGFWRLFIAGTLLSFWVFFVKKTPFPKLEKRFLWVLASGTFFFLHLWTYKFAAKNTLIANMMIVFATNPLWSTLGSIVFFKEKLSPRLIIAYFLGISAVVILVFNQIQFEDKSFYGDLSALVSAFFFSCYMLTGKGARKSYSNSVYAVFQYLTCALLFLVATTFTHSPFIGYSDLSWVAIAGLVVFPTFLGHLTMTFLMGHMNLTLMSCGKLIEPVLSALWAYLVFHEYLTTEEIVAFFLTACSILVLFAPNIFKLKSANKT